MLDGCQGICVENYSWKAHSEVDSTYTEYDTKRQARKAMLAVQEKMANATSARSRS